VTDPVAVLLGLIGLGALFGWIACIKIDRRH